MTDLIYVAGPYSSPDPLVCKARMEAFNAVMAVLITHGKHPVSPLLNHYVSEKQLEAGRAADFPLDWAYWKSYSLNLLRRCDRMVVVMADGWEHSSGVIAEIAVAESLGLPIDYVPV